MLVVPNILKWSLSCVCSMNFDMLYDEQYENEEDDDEFLFQSIKRYNTLQMFNLENIPQYLLQTDDYSICVASQRKKKENSELLKLKLPAKLTLPPEEEGRSKENDFKVLSGIYTESVLHKIDKLDIYNKLITSEDNISGLQVYSFTDYLLGEKRNQDQKLIMTPWPKPNFTVIQETTQAICSKSFCEPLVQVDISVGKKLREIEHPFYDFNIQPEICSDEVNPFISNSINCKALSTNLIAVLNSVSGNVVLYDIRTSNDFTFLPKSSESLSKEIWVLSDFDYKESSTSYFGIISNRKSFCIYENRKKSVVIQNTEKSTPKENHWNMKLKFNSSGDKFSISGMNSFVEIFQINNHNFQHVFTHNGHCPSNLPSAIVTDHIWLQAGGNEYIISVCQNGTLNCWDYKL